MSCPYAELHCLSPFTFLTGASTAEELVNQAKLLGYSALAITDECSLAGIVRAHVAAKEANLSLIIGSEIAFDSDIPIERQLRLVLLAPDREAYGDLAELITWGRRSASKGEYYLIRSQLEQRCERLLALWLDPSTAVELDQLNEDALWLREHFQDRLWIAASLHGYGDDHRLKAKLQAFSEKLDIPIVATGHVHQHIPERQILQDTLTAIRLGTPIAECGRQLTSNQERYLRPREMLARIYPSSWLEQSLCIAEKCRFSLEELKYEYPEELVPPHHTASSYLREVTEAGLVHRFPGGVSPLVRGQIESELALIAELSYEHFFLTVYDVVKWARGQQILCQGRGSAANSSVCYALGITEVDPARMSTLFERFISRERHEPPDIDVDFEHERREEVIQYLYHKYGRDRAALAAAVTTYRKRSALRDVGRALGFDESQIEQLSKAFAWWDRTSEFSKRLSEAGFDPESRIIRLLLELVGKLRGFPRHLSQHVGGFVLSRGPLCRMVPIENAAMPDRTIIQWDKDDLDAVGLLKVDVLSLGMLTALRRTFALVSKWRGISLTLKDIPAEDPKTYQMIQAADTIGVFQIESRAQMSMLPRFKPNSFYDLVIEVAIVRPGPIQGGMVHPYLRRRQGLEEVDYPSEAVRGVLERTLGIPIFQEQVMQLAVVAAGFTPGEADQLRRSMASWKKTGKLVQFREKLFQGMTARGYQQEFAERIYRQIEGFSEYGFPESHSASFALLAYASSWLKCHEPAAFTVALLNSQPMGFYGPSQLIQDARRHGVEVLPVDVQHSTWDHDLVLSQSSSDRSQPAIRLGMRLIQGLQKTEAEAIVQARASGHYQSTEDLAHRARMSSRTLALLAAAEALQSLTEHRRTAAWIAMGTDGQAPPLVIQRSAELPLFPKPTLAEEVTSDYRSLSLTLRPHPVSLLRRKLIQKKHIISSVLSNLQNRSRVKVCGLVTTRQRPGTASGVIFLTLEDEMGSINVVVWSQTVERYRKEVLGGRLLSVTGQVQQESGVIHVIARRIDDLTSWIQDLNTFSRDFH